MKIEELAKECRDRIEKWKQPPYNTFTSKPTIALVVKGVRLAGRSGPIGELVCENETDNVVAFDCEKVLKWLKKKGLLS